MNFLKNLSIRNKLLLISTVPMLALFYFVFTAVESELERKDIMLQVYDEFGEIEQMSKLLHECQIERGLVLAYLASQSRIDHDAMVNQRKFTNNASAEVQKIFARHKKDSPILSFLDSLSSYREASQNYANNLNRYKLLLLSEMGKTLRTSRNPVIKNHLESHVYLLHSKEYFAQLRSILASSIPLKKFKKGDYGTFALLKGAADRNYERFLNTASPDVVAVANIKFRGEGIARATQSIDSVFYDPDYLTRLNKEDWWAHSTNTIDVVKQIEDFSLGRVKEIAQAELASINRTVYISVGIAVGVIILIIILISVTIRQIVSTLSTIKDAAEKITNGEVDIEINVSSTDEIGALAGAFNKMIASTKKYAQAADIVGRGDYSVDLPVRSKSDVLGIALNNMRNNLKKLAQENEVRTWLLTGNNVLNDCMRGDKELTELSNEVITALTEYLKGQIGALYVRNNGHLVLSGSYAFDSANKRQLINIGEGLAGQAALTGKPILFNDVPGDYIKINSALGEAPPRNVLLYPIEYEGEVTGILEVGAAKDFSSVDMELLKVVGNNIGIAVHAAQARERLKLLLEETQRQAEELESQQEELRQFNEELQDKTQLLERSEEELKAQQEELQQTNEELAEKAGLLEEQKEALESAKMEIEEKVSELEIVSKYKSEFLANMSHELRTPLNSILILTQVLMENKTKSLNQKEVQYVNTIYHSGNDLLNLINQILDLSKIEAGKMEVDVEEFLIEDVVKNIQSAFAETAISKSIAFDIQASESMMASSIESDRQMLEQILKNFLANAFKFTERGGGVTLNIHHADKSVSFASRTLQSADKVIAFSVTDNGIGIPKEKFDVIFGAFQQVDGSTKR
ncbi:MAG TPA: nitrate- and nitrite sensing domain-containing protein, partial [Ohtaekwangia sp.]|nr:nitrate- and nitrite sensing domain-containing protein [Ohtaekwangia sp.]